MTTPSTLLTDYLAHVSGLLDGIEAALIDQAPDHVLRLCQQLQQTLQNRPQPPGKEWLPTTEEQAAAQLIDHRLAVLRKTLLQQGAAAERALTTLLPDRAVGVYSNKSGFGSAAVRSPHIKSFQA